MSKKDKKNEAPEVKEVNEGSKNEFEVTDPEVVRPRELPFLIKPANGKFENESQERYARVLNAYAYANPDKFASKKNALLRRLSEVGKNPGKVNVFMGQVDETLKIRSNRLPDTEE